MICGRWKALRSLIFPPGEKRSGRKEPRVKGGSVVGGGPKKRVGEDSRPVSCQEKGGGRFPYRASPLDGEVGGYERWLGGGVCLGGRGGGVIWLGL